MIQFQRLIRHAGSKSAVNEGPIQMIESLEALRVFAKSQKKVFSFVTSDGSHGIMRSGRKMRMCDSHVWNVKAPATF